MRSWADFAKKALFVWTSMGERALLLAPKYSFRESVRWSLGCNKIKPSDEKPIRKAAGKYPVILDLQKFGNLLWI
jgi:hypothetical protein